MNRQVTFCANTPPAPVLQLTVILAAFTMCLSGSPHADIFVNGQSSISKSFSLPQWHAESFPAQRYPVALSSHTVKEKHEDKATWQTIFSDDFEGAFPGSWELWHHPSLLEYDWGITTYSAHSGTRSVWCAGSHFQPGGSNYPFYFQSFMIYGPFDLSDALEAEVEFWFANVCSEVDDDYFAIWASKDGTNFWGTWWAGDQGSWRSHVFDLGNVHTLGNLCGLSEVWIAFVFNSNIDFAVGLGAFVDDVTIRKKTAITVETGSITCTLSPADAITAGAQWRVDGGTWQNTGAVVPDLAVGAHTVSFKTVTGWTPPGNQVVNVLAGQTASITGTYTAAATTGAITCTLSPADAITAGAKWRVDGGTWQNTGAVVPDLAVGAHTVSFKTVTGWTPPGDQVVNVLAGQTASITGTYTAAATTGAITCTLAPADAVTAGAQWRVDGGAWQNNGATVSGLAAGMHTVSFVALAGWTSPIAQNINVLAGQTVSITGTYIGETEGETEGEDEGEGEGEALNEGEGESATTGAITCTLMPVDAINAGAQWRVNSGAWQNSGATIFDLATGTRTVSFKALSGWMTPANQNVNVIAGQTASISVTYQLEDSSCGCRQSKRFDFQNRLLLLTGDWLLIGLSFAALFLFSGAERK